MAHAHGARGFVLFLPAVQWPRMTQSTTDPALVSRSCPTWRAWLALWIPVALALIALLSFNAWLDTWLWCATRWAVGESSWFYRHTDRLWQVCKDFGEAWMTLIILLLIAIYDRRKWFAALATLLATALAGGLGALIRIIDGRYRPTHTDAANHWELFRGFHNGTDLSFPSGHATLAFATAAALSYLSPKGRPVFLAIATGTAVSRVVMQAHFWSDALFGAALGWTVGWLTMQLTERCFIRRGLIRFS